MEVPQQARFANARLTDDQRHLAFTIEHAFPAIHQRAQFVVAPDKRGQSMRRCRRFEPPPHSARLDYAVELDRPFDALEHLRSAIFNLEQSTHQPMGICGYQYRARNSGFLYPRGKVGSVAEYVGILAGTGANHHRA